MMMMMMMMSDDDADVDDDEFCFLFGLRSGSESVSLIQDASHGWLSVKFGCCDSKLCSEQGSLGVMRIANLKQVHALKIREATTSIVEQFCCPISKMPLSKKKRSLSSIAIY